MGAEGPFIECPNCGTGNPSGFRFCGGCGQALERPCPSCGAVMGMGLAFCGACGASLSSVERPGHETLAPAGEERKVVSVLFADLVSSTELATRLDPEDLRELYGSYFEAMSAIVSSHGGALEKFIGDAVVGVFGAPLTHGDDPERAVRAGLAMLAAMAGLNRQLASDLGQDLALRVGIHTGEVIAAPGSDQALVTGETTSIAARLQAAAPPGGLVVSERTHRDVAASFEAVDLGVLELKGVGVPMGAWRITAEAARSDSDPVRPLVGRTDEIALLEVLLRRCARDQQPHLVTIIGSAGVGKSRLAYEFSRGSGIRWVRGRCLPYGSGLRLWPLAEIVKADAAILDSDPPDVIVEKARERIGRHLDGVDDADVILATVLSSIGFPSEPDPLAGVGRDAGQRMIVNAWSTYLSSLAAPGPLIAWIEDLHWGDDALLDLLEQLVGRIAAPVLLVCLARPELLERRPSWLRGSTSASTVELRPLRHTDGAALVDGLLDGRAEPTLADAIVERAGGNPFFATELVRTLTEDGAIEQRDGVWTASGEISAAMPDTVQMAIAARIDRLEPGVKTVLQMASVVGRTFWTGGLEELSGSREADAIEDLLERGLIRSRSTSMIAGSAEYIFDHALIHEVTYGSIPRARRADAHRSVLDWMERGTRGRDEEFAELLAHHADRAGDPRRTAKYAMLAGHRHRRSYAAEDAIRWYERAARAADEPSLDDTGSLRSEIAHSRGEAWEQLGRYEEALHDYREALAISRATGRDWLEAQELSAIAGALRSLQRLDEAEEVIPQALASAHAAGLEYHESRTMCLAGNVAWDRGDPVLARSHLEDGLRIAREARDLEGEAFARTGLTEIGLCQGPFDRAIEHGERARQLWRRLGHRPMGNTVAGTLGFLRLFTGDIGVAAHLFDTALAGARELGMQREEPLPLIGLALISMQQGELGDALTTLDEAIEIADANVVTTGSIAGRLARIALLQELDATDPLKRALDELDGTAPGVHTLGAVRRAARAWTLLREGDDDGARAAFLEARIGAEGLLLSRIACGRIEIAAWSRAGDRDAAADAAAWLLEGAREQSPAAEALATWARVRAGNEVSHPSTVTELATRAGDPAILWRALALAAQIADDRGDPAGARAGRGEAAAVIAGLAASVRGDELRSSFLAAPDVAEVSAGAAREPEIS
jgi:class 3 adenylate cyclase/tetratricopeptide (TPR) repeat protein